MLTIHSIPSPSRHFWGPSANGKCNGFNAKQRSRRRSPPQKINGEQLRREDAEAQSGHSRWPRFERNAPFFLGTAPAVAVPKAVFQHAMHHRWPRAQTARRLRDLASQQFYVLRLCTSAAVLFCVKAVKNLDRQLSSRAAAPTARASARIPAAPCALSCSASACALPTMSAPTTTLARSIGVPSRPATSPCSVR